MFDREYEVAKQRALEKNYVDNIFRKIISPYCEGSMVVFANKLGISYHAVLTWSKGLTQPSREVAIKIVEFGMSRANNTAKYVPESFRVNLDVLKHEVRFNLNNTHNPELIVKGREIH
jgi:hypothetical protein